MMHSAFSLFAITFAVLLSAAVADELIVKVVCPQAELLTEVEVAAIEVAKDTMDRRNRNLRSDSRRLDPYWCDEVCAGWPFPYCQVWQRQCYDHRRALSEHEMQRARSLASAYELVEVVGSSCDNKKDEVLLLLESAVTDESQSIVDASHISCFELREICEVVGFNLWNSETDTKTMSGLTDGAQINNADFDFSIEAFTDDCVSNVDFLLEGPNGFQYSHFERQYPYLLFGNRNSDIKAYSGSLENGQYTLKVMADENESTLKTLSFELV